MCQRDLDRQKVIHAKYISKLRKNKSLCTTDDGLVMFLHDGVKETRLHT